MKPSDRDVLELLRQRGSAGVTSLDALTALGCFRLGARVWDLRAEGYAISSEMVTTAGGKRIAKYVLHGRPPLDEVRRTILLEEIELGLV